MSSTEKGVDTLYHIYPLNDLREHELTLDCWCHPSVEDYGVLHKSMDKREEYENGRKLS